MKVKNIVAFLVLMKGDIWDKSPDYIMEKFNRYCLSERDDEYLWGLDADNAQRLHVWRLKWDPEYKAMNQIKK